MALEALTPQNTTVLLMDYALGFGNVFRSHPLALNELNARLLADTALTYESGLVATNGPPHKASGPYYSELLKLLGNTQIVERGGMFNAFLFDGFKKAVANTKRSNLVIGGLVTEGCVLQTVLGGLREGYNMYVAVDACAGASREIHDAAIQRMMHEGAVPLTCFALASEFQVDQGRPDGKKFIALTAKYQPEMNFMSQFFEWAQQDAKNTEK